MDNIGRLAPKKKYEGLASVKPAAMLTVICLLLFVQACLATMTKMLP